MASVSGSQIIGNLGVGVDKKSLKLIQKMFKDMEKGYQTTIKTMSKSEQKRNKESKRSITQLKKEYQKMFKEIQKGSDGIDFSNLAIGLNSATDLIGKAMNFLAKGEERVKGLVDSTASLDQFSRRMKVDIESIQLLQNEGGKLGIDDSEIKSFISTMNSARLAMERGEMNDQTSGLQKMMGVKRGDSNSEIINKVFGSLSKQDEQVRKRMLGLVGVTDDLIEVFSELTSMDIKDVARAKAENRTRAMSNSTAKQAFEVQKRLEKKTDQIDKQFLEGSLGSYEESQMANLDIKNATDKAAMEINKKMTDLKVWATETALPAVEKGIEDAKRIMNGIGDTFKNIGDEFKKMNERGVGGYLYDLIRGK